MKLLLVILEGQLYLAATLAIFAAELAFLSWGLWSRRPIIGLIAVFTMVPLIRSTASAIRACFVRIPPPEGLLLDKSEGGALYDFVEEVRRAVAAPPIDGITITGGFNASATVYWGPWRLSRRRVLVLGWPVLTTLSTAELRAVVAHELAHFSRAHDAFAAWVYVTRRGWFALRAALDERMATPIYVYWFVRWYVPRLNVASAEVARRHEFVADRVAARVAGSRATADALVVIEAGETFLEDTFWPKVDVSHEMADEAPRPFSQMLAWDARTIGPAALDALFADETMPWHTHPSLRERFDRLQESTRMPPVAVRSAGDEILGVELGNIAAELDRRWLAQNGEAWIHHHAEHLERRARLAQLAAIEAPTPDELFKRAELLEGLEGARVALPIFQSAADQGHPAAGLAAGRLLLDRLDGAGVALIETSMERDESLVPEGCTVLAEYYKTIRQDVAARKCERRATRHTTRLRLGPGSRVQSPGSRVQGPEGGRYNQGP